MRTLIAAMVAFFTLFSVNAHAASNAKCSKGSHACSSAKKSTYAKKRYAKKRYAKKRYTKKRYAKKRYAKKRYAKRYAKKRYTKRRSKYKTARRSGGGYTGIASYYWQPQAVASGGRFNPNALTAAHKTLPFGTLVRVTHLGNGRSVTVRINDRGPYIKGRIIDLSRRAAGVIRMRGQGIARVKIQVVGRSKKRRG
ncbi:MAG: septal ring lytic transglycosylase RlpA family protein [Hyphomicrobiaceae bacterium]